MFEDDRGRTQRIGDWLAEIDESLSVRSDTALEVLPYRLAKVRQLIAGLSATYLAAHPKVGALELASFDDLASGIKPSSAKLEIQVWQANEVFGPLLAALPPPTPNPHRRINLDSRRADVLRTLSGLEHSLRGRGIVALHLFGSVARREDGPESDVDLAFVVDDDAHSFSLFDQAAIMNDLAAALGRRVDLVELTSLNGEMRQRVEQEWVAIFV